MTVIIVGAGIGGLTTALQLHARGVKCEVYEKNDDLRPQGVGINLLPAAVLELARLGLLGQLDKIGVRTGTLTYLHHRRGVIMRRPCGLDAGFEVPQFSVHRGQLAKMLAGAVIERMGAATIQRGHMLERFEQNEDQVHAYFVNGRGYPVGTASGDALVGADGIHSRTRRQLQPGEGRPRWSGIRVWRGATDFPAFGGGRSMIIAGRLVGTMIIYPIAPGATSDTMLTNWALGIQVGNPGDPAPRDDWSQRTVDRDELTQYLPRFTIPDVDHARLVSATEQVFRFPVCDRDPLSRWSHGRVTLLGDAAHPMYPAGAMGAGQSILDATRLAECLAAMPAVTTALAEYERTRLPMVNELLMENRAHGPESVIADVERAAPDGFTRLGDVADPVEILRHVDRFLAV